MARDLPLLIANWLESDSFQQLRRVGNLDPEQAIAPWRCEWNRLGGRGQRPDNNNGIGGFSASDLEDQFCGSHRRWQDRGRIDFMFQSKAGIRDQPKASA